MKDAAYIFDIADGGFTELHTLGRMKKRLLFLAENMRSVPGLVVDHDIYS